MNERVVHVNRIKGLLFSQGVSGYEPLRRDRRRRLDELKTGDGRPLPPHLKAHVVRELERLELLLEQIKAVEGERDALLAPEETKTPEMAMLLAIKGVGPEFAAVLWSECLSGHSLIDARSPLTRAWRRLLGRADRSIMNKASPKPAIRDCERRLSSSLGYGCAISRTRRWPSGFMSGSGATAAVSKDDDRGAGAQASRGAVEICHGRHRHRGGRYENRLRRTPTHSLQSSRTCAVLTDPGRTDRRKPWPNTPIRRMVLVLLSPIRSKRDIGPSLRTTTECEVDR